MSNSKHTPGPWTVLPEEADKDYLRIRGTRLGGRYKVANVHMPRLWESHYVLRDRANAESGSNARLIAAAPDLLEALKACAAVCAGETMSKSGLIHALEKARAALARATGEQP